MMRIDFPRRILCSRRIDFPRRMKTTRSAVSRMAEKKTSVSMSSGC